MSLGEVMTCVRENIPVVGCVFDNREWGEEKRRRIDFDDDRRAATMPENPSFAAIARAMGARGVVVDKPAQVGDALRAAVQSERPTVSEIQVSHELGEPLRRDALRIPVRLLPKYAGYGRR